MKPKRTRRHEAGLSETKVEQWVQRLDKALAKSGGDPAKLAEAMFPGKKLTVKTVRMSDADYKEALNRMHPNVRRLVETGKIRNTPLPDLLSIPPELAQFLRVSKKRGPKQDTQRLETVRQLIALGWTQYRIARAVYQDVWQRSPEEAYHRLRALVADSGLIPRK